MNITCPKCGEVIALNEDETAAILRQVSEDEISRRVEEARNAFDEKMKIAVELEKAKASAEAKQSMQNAIDQYKEKVGELKSQLATNAEKNKLAIENAKNEAENIKRMEIEDITKKRDAIIAELERQVDYYKNFKLQQSTKMVGESLEQHCLEDYNLHLRSLLSDAYFEKDNEISETGSKGDFIYREEKDGVPLLSIMFEMKNDSETTEKRHSNEYFFKELDKDRREKDCEYAVLVSLLESDSEYYNQGIVDVSYRYPKMYVIRPQFLCSFITLLRNAALKAHECRIELETIRTQNVDVTNFEAKLETFKTGFTRSCELTQKKFDDAITQIDKAIADLTKVRDALTMSGKHLTEADGKIGDLTIRSLTFKNPTMKQMFANAGLENNDSPDIVQNSIFSSKNEGAAVEIGKPKRRKSGKNT